METLQITPVEPVTAGLALIERGEAPLLCAWCHQHGHAGVAMRAPHTQQWTRISDEEARARWHTATHGICPACKALVSVEWGLEN